MKTLRAAFVLTLCIIACSSHAQLFGRGGKTNAKARSGVIRMKQFNDTLLGTYFWSHFDATKRSSLNFIKSGRVQVLAEVQPDAVVQKALELAVKGNSGNGLTGDASLKTAQTIAELGQRTAAVNMLRDGLYRIAELRYNDPEGYSPQIVQAMMNSLFDMVENVAIHTVPEKTDEHTTTTDQPVTAAKPEGAEPVEKPDAAPPKN